MVTTSEWIYITSGSVISLAILTYMFLMLKRKSKNDSTEFAKGLNEEEGIIENSSSRKSEKSFDIIDTQEKVSWFRFFKKRKHKKLKEKEHESVIIIFETFNAKFKMWLQHEVEDGFKYKGKKYVFDPTQRIHFPDINKYGYFFQEAITIPVNKSVKINPKINDLIVKIQKDIDGYFKTPLDKHVDPVKIREAIYESGLTEIENAIEPKSLLRFIDTQVILQVMGGAWFTKIMKIVLILCLVLLVMNLIMIGGLVYIGWETWQASQAA